MKDKKNKRGPLTRQRKSKWQKWWLEYFDWNQDGKTNWWEYTIPFVVILIIEIIAEIIASWIF